MFLTEFSRASRRVEFDHVRLVLADCSLLGLLLQQVVLEPVQHDSDDDADDGAFDRGMQITIDPL